MKLPKITLYSLLLLLLIGTVACERKYDAPLLSEPKAPEGIAPNLTIAEYKQKFDAVQQNTPQLIDTEYVIKGVVVGNDISGNIYKEIYIQDETGGIKIGCDQNNISADYPIGQEVYVRLHGLYAIRYGGQLQIGMQGTGRNAIPYEIFKKNVIRNGWSDPQKATITPLTLADLNDKHLGKLVQFDNVYFEGDGKLTYADTKKERKGSTNRNLYDAQGRSLVVRNSDYANFAADLLPAGHGTVVGILSKFGDTYQLTLRSKDDVRNFQPGMPPSAGGNNGGNSGTGIEIGGGTGSSTPAEAPKVTGELLFPGADFNNWATFEAGVNEFKGKKFTLAEESKDGGLEGSGAINIKGKNASNGYAFTVGLPENFKGANATKITFFLKGKATGRSLSINVYNTNKEIQYEDNKTKEMKPSGYVCYNLGDLTKSETYLGSTKNSYYGSIDTQGNWVKVTMELKTSDGKQVILPTTKGDNLIAFKFGKAADYNLLIDEIRFE